jgi:chloramphenicol 3-O-phosphotransferase
LILLRGTPGAGKSSVAPILAAKCGSDWGVVEIDEIKTRHYGTPERCDDPPLIFGEGGSLALHALDQGNSVIGVEQFNSRWLIDLFLRPTGLTYGSPSLMPVWLSCTLEKALARKTGTLPPHTVIAGHQAAASRLCIERELVLDTTETPAATIAEQLHTMLRDRAFLA